MEDTFVGFELAKLAKEKGFAESCYGYYDVNKGYEKGYSFCYHETQDDEDLKLMLAPTQSLLAKWLREVHDIIIVSVPCTVLEYDSWGQDCSNVTDSKSNEVVTYGDGSHTYEYYIWKLGCFEENESPFLTYEEALEAGLLTSLNLIK